jgi:hypothetical protein
MTKYPLLLALILFSAACAPRTSVRHDDFDRAIIAQLRGNYVSGRIFGKTVLTLNPRRETRSIQWVTNTAVEFETNHVATAVTNLLVTSSTNYATALSTNDNPPSAAPSSVPTRTEEDAVISDSGQTNILSGHVDSGLTNKVVTALPPPPLTNQTVTSGMNRSVLRGNNQLNETAQELQGTIRQISFVTNNQTVTSQLNEIVTIETNKSISFLTNQAITAVTNVSRVETNILVHDYYLFTELIAPQDFTPISGESLILLIDGERFGFTATNSTAAFVGRKRFTTTFYKVPEDLFSKIASAKEVRLRIRGINAVIERELTDDNQEIFQEFLKRVGPEEMAEGIDEKKPVKLKQGGSMRRLQTRS